MAEHLKLFVAPTNSEDIQAEADITDIELTNFDAVPGSTGTFSRKPKVIVTLDDDTEADPTGFCFSFDFGLNNRVKSASITVSGSGGSYTTTYAPQAPYIADTIDSSYTPITEIELTINSALIPGIPLKFGGFHFGENSVDISTGVKSCKVIQSADLSGQTCPFSTLTATFQGNGISSFFPYGQKITCKTDVKDIGNFYVTECTTTRRALNYDGVNQFSLSAMSMMGVLAEYNSYRGLENMYWTTGAPWPISVVMLGLTDRDARYSPDLSIFNDSLRLNSFWANIPKGLDHRSTLAYIAFGSGFWIDPDGEFHKVDLSSTPIVIPRSRIYDNPTITSRETISSIEFKSYSVLKTIGTSYTRTLKDGTSVTDTGKSFNVYDETKSIYYDAVDTYSRAITGGSKKIIDSTALPSWVVPSTSLISLHDTIELIQASYWYRSDIWTGKILWNTATNEGRLGTRVTVYDQAGQTFTGNVISSNLNFSGASVVAEIQVLKDGT